MTALVWLLLTASSWLAVRGQEQTTPPDRMLLSLLQGHRYERVTYDARGKLTDRAVLVIGRITMDAGELSVPLNVEVYKGDAVERRFSSTWTCASEASAMMMSVLVFGEDAGKPRLRLESTGAPLVYPAQVPPSGRLPDVSVDVRVRQGVLGFLGARSRTTFSDRRIAATPRALNGESAKRAYSITSRVEFRAYAWGVRVRRTRFRSEETVDPEKGLLQHVLRSEDGGYSALRRLSPTPGT